MFSSQPFYDNRERISRLTNLIFTNVLIDVQMDKSASVDDIDYFKAM